METKVFTNPQEFFNMIFDNEVEIASVRVLGIINEILTTELISHTITGFSGGCSSNWIQNQGRIRGGFEPHVGCSRMFHHGDRPFKALCRTGGSWNEGLIL
ncbi:MAG: hypothetical protein DRQ65_02830 [Gammaproteobacteria bacterium]|nr:MAG: hypothetical protein DRQ65_02830 [Gammaproteobacteria bacterium]